MGDDWPLVGRERELTKVRQMLDSGGRGVLLAGAAGVGKTRLAEECLEMAARHGLVVARVTATRAAAGLPLGALAPLLPAVHHGEGAGVDTAAHLLRRSASALVERAGSSRLGLLVDDAHLLDDASATLIHQLAATGRAFILVTIRNEEQPPDPVTALWKDRLLERVDVPALSAEAVEELVSTALGGPIDRGTVAQLAVRAMGNALFLRELMIGALETGVLADVGGLWRLTGPLAPSQRLVEIVEARLSGLDPAERDLLEVLSYGEPFGPAELSALGDQGVAERLERKALLSSRLDNRRVEVRLAHPVFGDVLRQRIPVLRGRAIARSLAEALEATGARRREDTLRVAIWRLDGGGAQPDRMLAAASTARWRYDFPLAERLARAAVEAGAGFDAALLAAQLAGLQGRSAQAEEELAALALQASTDAERGNVAINQLDNLVFYQARIDAALRMVEEAEAAITAPEWRDEITARRSGVLLATHGPRACIELGARLIREASGRALVWACISGGYSLGRLGRLEAALDVSTRGHAAHVTLSQPLDWDPCMHVFFRCEALAQAGCFDEAEALATAHYQQSIREHNTDAQAFFAYHLGKTVGARGHIAAATRNLREAMALFTQLGRPLMVHFCLTYLALAAALGGRPDEADLALQQNDDLGLPPTMYVATDLLQSRAWAAVAAGDIPTACLLLSEAATLGADIGDLAGEAASLHGLARLGHPKEAVTGLRSLTTTMEGELVRAQAGHAEALAERSPKGLQEASLAFERMGANLLAAEAAADAAVAFGRGGRPRDATGAEQRTATLRTRCQGAVTPALQTVAGRARLTRSEREIALLASANFTNKEIGEKLVLSARTIGNHLQHVYEKLGISRRGELKAALEAGGWDDAEPA